MKPTAEFSRLQADITRGKVAEEKLRGYAKSLREQADAIEHALQNGNLEESKPPRRPTPVAKRTGNGARRKSVKASILKATTATANGRGKVAAKKRIKFAWKGQKWSGGGTEAGWYTAAKKAGVTDEQMMAEAKKLQR